jgi:hypothetical protein
MSGCRPCVRKRCAASTLGPGVLPGRLRPTARRCGPVRAASTSPVHSGLETVQVDDDGRAQSTACSGVPATTQVSMVRAGGIDSACQRRSARSWRPLGLIASATSADCQPPGTRATLGRYAPNGRNSMIGHLGRLGAQRRHRDRSQRYSADVSGFGTELLFIRGVELPHQADQSVVHAHEVSVRSLARPCGPERCGHRES